MDEQRKRCIDIIPETSFSNMLSVVPIKEFDYVLNKQMF